VQVRERNKLKGVGGWVERENEQERGYQIVENHLITIEVNLKNKEIKLLMSFCVVWYRIVLCDVV
jgi:hypothetical protein